MGFLGAYLTKMWPQKGSKVDLGFCVCFCFVYFNSWYEMVCHFKRREECVRASWRWRTTERRAEKNKRKSPGQPCCLFAVTVSQKASLEPQIESTASSEVRQPVYSHKVSLINPCNLISEKMAAKIQTYFSICTVNWCCFYTNLLSDLITILIRSFCTYCFL